MFFDEEELFTLEQAQAEADAQEARQQPQQPVVTQQVVTVTEKTTQSRVSQDIETILYKAQLYRQFLGGGSIFDGDSSDITKEVEEEFAEFAQDRLSTLLGLKQPKSVVEATPPQFDPREVEVLKLLAKKLGKATAAQQITTPPTVQRTPVKEPEAPTIRRTKIQPPKQAAPQKAAKPASQVAPQVVKPVDKTIAPKDGETVEEEGKRFKITWLPVEASAKFLADVANIPDGISINTPEGQLVKSGGKLNKVLRREMRKNIKTGGVPMPTGNGFELAMARQTQEAVSSLGSRKLF